MTILSFALLLSSFVPTDLRYTRATAMVSGVFSGSTLWWVILCSSVLASVADDAAAVMAEPDFCADFRIRHCCFDELRVEAEHIFTGNYGVSSDSLANFLEVTSKGKER